MTFGLGRADRRTSLFTSMVNKFRVSPAYASEYGGARTGAVGTPLRK
jgi:hypothetical protein